MNKRFVTIMLVGIAIFAGLLFWGKKDSSTNNNDTSSQATNHTYGESPDGVSVVEYGDFQCPACFSYFPIFSQLKEEYKDRVVFQFRHFPLIQIHQNAMAAHRAAEAAGLQNKFWEMHDLLYQNQKSWESSSNPAKIFEDYARQLSLDMDKFAADVTSGEVNAAVQADIKAGQDLGANSTPTFVVNGKTIELPSSIEEFRQVIDTAIKEKTAE